jgi:DNA-binding transcriptional ArsR family regulator
MRRDVFQAIADPTRREIVDLLAGKSLTLNNIADNFRISRPAVSKHIKILTECGLVIIKQKGRERHCEVQLQPLQEVSLWAQQYRRFWTAKFDSLEKFLGSSVPQKNTKRKKIKK